MSAGKDSSFASLFEQEAPRAQTRPLKLGERVRFAVIQVGRETLFGDLEGRRQVFMDVADFVSRGEPVPAVGDFVDANIVSIDRQTQEIRVGRSLGKASGIESLEQAKEAGLPISGKVTGVNKGGLEVELGGVRAFCPVSQVELRFVQDVTQYVGRDLQFMVTEIRENGRKVVLSRKKVLEQEQAVLRVDALAKLVVGAIMRGTVISTRDFGAFVDLGGIEGLIPASELSHERRVQVKDVVSPGDSVDVQVLAIADSPKTPGEKKVTLSLKALRTDPWEGATRFVPGTVAEGTVTRLADFGAFIRVSDGIEGLLHISEMPGKPARAADVFTPDQKVNVVIGSVDLAARKVSLALAPDDAVVGSRVAQFEASLGAIVNCIVDRIETYGIFVQIEGTKARAGRGLIPNNELGTPRGSDTRKLFPLGTKFPAKVIESAGGRIKLSIKAVKEDEERADYEGFRAKSAASSTMGTFGDLLKKLQK